MVRTGDLVSNILQELCLTGITIADVSVPNPNVCYELGLCHAIGRDTLLFKQTGTNLPADLAGAHYYEYSLQRLDEGRKQLASHLKTWSTNNDLTLIKSAQT